ncbi:sialate O-acetylesterase [Xylanibacter ruminicola]|uniref:Sialic acid-specific 9-O-acetylesterase-like protein n=2 Tax=Xylanibacter ruminicola TaxID=839 RepID=D5EXA5_XYLR2|nr:sialate O-acetylesterase [Xylanibacter ruminicola]ADE81487.1 sialic acid-specific 9-O-acetylesterase-like protein [Xylanibacter ruminicola 23]SEH85242.1 sialate O-acetylesterase [Xylanibacter ruminicola]
MKKIIFFCATLFCLSVADAKVTMPKLFQSGMVVQRGKLIPVWGHADAGEAVTVRFNKKVYQTTADADGRWRVDLPKMKAGGPYQLTVNDQTIDNILVGDVWLLSGQSNIDVTIERVYPQYTQEIDNYENNEIRLFRVQNETSTHGVKEDIRHTNINWKPVNKQNAWLFSAAGYFLGKRMFQTNKVPQGIIVNSWGGTPIEAWISEDSLKADYPMLIKKLQMYQNDNYVRAQMQANGAANQQWESILNQTDPGYADVAVDETSWQQIDQNNWTWRGTGSVWLRQHITIDKEHAGKPARLLLGTLFDRDVTYLNGKQIGQTGYQYPPRRYDIPEGMLKEGDNVIAIRFINKFGAVHFIPEKPYMLCFGDDRLSQNPMPKDVQPLSQLWKMKVGAEMPQCPSSDVSLQNLPTTLYNAVLYPLAPYAINGVVWYQGESNTGNPAPYADHLKKLMGSWRDRWNDLQMPFVIVQLANYDGRQQTGFPRPITPQTEPVNSGWAQLREAQRVVAKADAKAELAVINDLGETVDIHPLRKKEVAERIGLCFDKLLYNNKVKLSPEVVSTQVSDAAIQLTLDQPIQEGDLYTFEVCNNGNNTYQNVPAVGKGNVITLLVPQASQASALKIRYAWKDDPKQANVRSLSGLPMSSFELSINN